MKKTYKKATVAKRETLEAILAVKKPTSGESLN